jgi:hypothetical protein
MVNEQVDVFPASSVAVLVTVVVPTGKLEPEGWLDTIETPEPLKVKLLDAQLWKVWF